MARSKIKRKASSGASNKRDNVSNGTASTHLHGLKSKKPKNKRSDSFASIASDRTPKRKWNKPCLKKDFSEIHPLRECNNTTHEKKKELLEKYYNEKKAAKSVRAADSKAHLDDVHARHGLYRVLLNEKNECVALGDNGAECSDIGIETIETLKQHEANLSVRKFRTPVELLLAAGKSNERNEKHLETFGPTIDGHDVSELQGNPPKVAKATYRGMV